MRIIALLLAVAVATPALADKANVGADKDKLICKRETPIGSLIASRKTCLTRAQWVQREKDGNEEARKMIQDNAGRPTSN